MGDLLLNFLGKSCVFDTLINTRFVEVPLLIERSLR